MWILSFKNWKVNTLLSKNNTFFSRFEVTRGEKTKYFAPKWSFDVWTSQKCKYLFVNSHFQGRHYFTWRNISKFSEDFEGYGQGPSLFLTDYGACCTLIPHLDFETKDKNKSLSSIYHELKADSKSGDNFGLDIGAKYLGVFFLSFPQNERKIY